jgi:hypothetical protein
VNNSKKRHEALLFQERSKGGYCMCLAIVLNNGLFNEYLAHFALGVEELVARSALEVHRCAPFQKENINTTLLPVKGQAVQECVLKLSTRPSLVQEKVVDASAL